MSLRNEHVDKVMELWEKDVLFNSTWMGAIAAKNPCDAWLYQEIIYKVRPDFILETGSFKGGGALFLASLLDLCNIDGVVYSVDITNYKKPEHPKIHWLTGNSVQADLVSMIHTKARGKKVLIILDSDHEANHVIQEMLAYEDIVSPGSYMIVEDTWWRPGVGGPHDAVQEFLKEHTDFKIDETMHRYLFTNNPNGFLQKNDK